MSDYYPERARGIRGEGGKAVPPRPDDDEMWEYLADHLRAIRSSVAILAFLAVCQIIGAVLWVMIAANGAT